MHDVVIVGHPEALGMELLGAWDMFGMANQWLTDQGREPHYRRRFATLDGHLTLWGGLTLSPCEPLGPALGDVDSLVVIGGHHAHEASQDPAFITAVRQVAERSGRVVGLCTGAFVLAAAGLLEGKRATTHWMFGDLLAARHPGVQVDTDPIFIAEKDTWTSAGITASFDLLLAVIEEDLGVDAARMVARTLVVFLRRPGNQAQFSAQLAEQLADRHPIRELQQFIAEHPGDRLTLNDLAARVQMSPRHFTRVFRAEIGISPGRYVERARLEAARRRLEETEQSVAEVAVATGFGSSETLRRTFVATLGVAPAEYRQRFGVARGRRPSSTPV
jgi:transcriptional regulator GlxA family with amidase domain